MPKYEINYTLERWYRVSVEAESEAEALRKFHNDDCGTPYDIGYGDILQDSIEIMEATNA